jgi:hypothetical protein
VLIDFHWTSVDDLPASVDIRALAAVASARGGGRTGRALASDRASEHDLLKGIPR